MSWVLLSTRPYRLTRLAWEDERPRDDPFLCEVCNQVPALVNEDFDYTDMAGGVPVLLHHQWIYRCLCGDAPAIMCLGPLLDTIREAILAAPPPMAQAEETFVRKSRVAAGEAPV